MNSKVNKCEMKVGLIQIDGKMPNLALMKLSKWHKERGDDVTVIDLSNFQFDRTYASKVFAGGSGVDLKSELPKEIEAVVPDYNQFKTDYSIGFTTRGCIRDCGFCIVREKEGNLKEANMDWIRHNKIIIMDSNFLASSNCKEKLKYFINMNMKVNFSQGLDIRLIDEKIAELLARTKSYDRRFKRRQYYFAFDYLSLEPTIRKNIKLLIEKGIKPEQIMVYMLVGYNTTHKQDMHRYKVLWEELGVYPFVMIYNDKKNDRWIRNFARWVNKRVHKISKFEEYKK